MKKYKLEFTKREMLVLANAVGAMIPLLGNEEYNPLDNYDTKIDIRNKLLDEVIRRENL